MLVFHSVVLEYFSNQQKQFLYFETESIYPSLPWNSVQTQQPLTHKPVSALLSFESKNMYHHTGQFLYFQVSFSTSLRKLESAFQLLMLVYKRSVGMGNVYFFVVLCECVHVLCECQLDSPMWRSEDSLLGLVLFFYYVSSEV